jgi:HlyD family secretion protein
VKKWIIILVVVAAVGALIYASIAKSKGRGTSVVETALVTREHLTAIVRASGTIEPKRSVNVSANVIGTVTRLEIAEGQTVAKGDLLLEIDPTEYRVAVQAYQAAVHSGEADLRLAEASADKAKQDLARADQLFAGGLSTEEQLLAARTTDKVEVARVEAARSRLQQARANLDKARYDLDKVTITAPMSGIVTKLNVEQGENAIMGTLNNPGTVLLTIADLDTMEAWVDVDETEVVNVNLGQPAEIEIDAFPDSTFYGDVTEIGHSPLNRSTGAGQQAVDFEIKITLRDRITAIRPGLSAKAEIMVADRDSTIAVPLGAVTMRSLPLKAADIRVYSGGQAKKQAAALADLGFSSEGAPETVKTTDAEGVFVVKDGFVRFQPVQLGIAGEDHFEILGGLEPGATVVSGPFRVLRELKDGTAVTITKKSTKDGGKKQKEDNDS